MAGSWNRDDNVQDFIQIAAMTCMENGILYSLVDTSAIAQGYRLAFPEKATELDEGLLGEDEYREWYFFREIGRVIPIICYTFEL